MIKIKTSSPGKLILFGEHSVIYNYPCIVTTVSPRIFVEIEGLSGESKIEATQVKNTRFVEETISLFKKKYNVHGALRIKTYNNISSKYGLGSSSAVTVATIYALCKYYKIVLSNKEIFDLGYKVVRQVQGVGSGFDIAAAIYGGTLYYIAGGEAIEPLIVRNMYLVIGYSGVKANTSEIVKNLESKIKDPSFIKTSEGKLKLKYIKIFKNIKKIVNLAKISLINSDWEKTGELMNQNHKYLQQLGVSTKKLDDMCRAAISSGAYGAKLSGAGGGDCMIALVSEDKIKSVRSAIVIAGGKIVEIDNNSQGVKLEKI